MPTSPPREHRGGNQKCWCTAAHTSVYGPLLASSGHWIDCTARWPEDGDGVFPHFCMGLTMGFSTKTDLQLLFHKIILYVTVINLMQVLTYNKRHIYSV